MYQFNLTRSDESSETVSSSTFSDGQRRTVTGTAPLTVSFTDETIGDPTFYSYDFGDGFTATGRNPVHTYRFPGVYTVSLTVLKVDPGSGSLQRSSELKTDLIVVNAA